MSIDAQKLTIGKIIMENPELEKVLDPNSPIEVLAEGFKWSEGPVWSKTLNGLLFSDVPGNTIYFWQEGKPLEVFLQPSGYTGKYHYSFEPGSNGLIINQKDELVACEHGDRRVSKMPIAHKGGKVTIADSWQGKRFNSPNDIIQHSSGKYIFTDPPYGLPNREKDSSREIDEFGVFISDGKSTTLLIGDLERPNGLALSPREDVLYINQSHPDKAYIMAYPISKNLEVGDGKILFDTTPMVKKGLKGLPDGLKVDQNGYLFATGPGGVLVLNPNGEYLGRIDTEQATANCNWGGDGTWLYITANNYLCRIKTKTKGALFTD